MAQQTYTQAMNKTDNGQGPTNVSIGQTRDGKDEWITPVSLWERQLSTGLYLPPGAIADHEDVGKPRVKADELEALLDSLGEKDYSTEQTLLEVLTKLNDLKTELDAIKDNQTNGEQKAQQSGRYIALEDGQLVKKTDGEIRCLSTDTKPDASTVDIYQLLIEMDTGDIYYSDGTTWQVYE